MYFVAFSIWYSYYVKRMEMILLCEDNFILASVWYQGKCPFHMIFFICISIPKKPFLFKNVHQRSSNSKNTTHLLGDVCVCARSYFKVFVSIELRYFSYFLKKQKPQASSRIDFLHQIFSFCYVCQKRLLKHKT